VKGLIVSNSLDSGPVKVNVMVCHTFISPVTLT